MFAGGRNLIVRFTIFGSFCTAHRIEREVDFSQAEASQFDIEFEIDEVLEFDREQLAVPARIECELVVRQDVGAPLGLAQQRLSGVFR